MKILRKEKANPGRPSKLEGPDGHAGQSCWSAVLEVNFMHASAEAITVYTCIPIGSLKTHRRRHLKSALENDVGIQQCQATVDADLSTSKDSKFLPTLIYCIYTSFSCDTQLHIFADESGF